jgi:hypothetical protein
MADRVKSFVIAELPAELVSAFLQHIRVFDAEHPDCHIEFAADLPKVSVAEAVKMISINPRLSFETVLAPAK